MIAGSSLAAVLSTALTSTATFSASGCIDPLASLLICVPAGAMAPLGARLTSRLDCAALKRLLGYFLLAAAPLIPFKGWLLSSRLEEGKGPQAAPQRGSDTSAGSVPEDVPIATSDTTTDAMTAAAGAAGVTAASWVQQLWQSRPDAGVMVGLAATGAAAGFASGLLGIGGGTVGEQADSASIKGWGLQPTAPYLGACPALTATIILSLEICLIETNTADVSIVFVLPAATPLVALLLPCAQATVLGTTLLAMIPPTAVGLLQHHR